MVPAVAVKLAVKAPAGTVTEGGTGSSPLVLDSVTAAPPLGAAPERVTEQPVDCLELRLLGLQAKPATVGGGGGTSWILVIRDVLL